MNENWRDSKTLGVNKVIHFLVPHTFISPSLSHLQLLILYFHCLWIIDLELELAVVNSRTLTKISLFLEKTLNLVCISLNFSNNQIFLHTDSEKENKSEKILAPTPVRKPFTPVQQNKTAPQNPRLPSLNHFTFYLKA